MLSRFAASPIAASARTCIPVVFALAATIGMVVTLSSVVGTPAVDIRGFRSVGHDALSIYLGHGLYHDPSGTGYTGLLYTPLMPAIVAGLDVLGRWNGWPVLITIVATLVLATAIARLALRAAGERGLCTLVGAAGMSGLTVWLVTATVGLLYLGFTDELAWAFAISALLVGARARGPRTAAATIALFTLAFWSKQTALAPALAYGIWLCALTVRGQRSIRFTAALLGTLLLVNLAVLGLLNLLTGGWEFYFNFTLPTRQARIFGDRKLLSDLVEIIAPPALWAAALCAVVVGRDWRTRVRLDSAPALLCVFVVIGTPLALYFRSKQGGNSNQYYGLMWAIGGLAAIAWGASRRAGGILAVDALIAMALVGALAATAAGDNRYDFRQLRTRYSQSIPADLRVLGRDGGLFHPLFTDLTPGQVYEDVFNLVDLLASDQQPMSLVRALLARRFKYAVTFADALGPYDMGVVNEYASAYGLYEDNYFWKLDQVIAAGYGPGPGLPAGVLVRRPGRNRAAVLSACFGPFELGGRQWMIRHGGGLWCRVAPGIVTLVASPAAASELISDGAARVAGTLRLTARPGAAVALTSGSWRALARRGPRGWTVRIGASARSSSTSGQVLSLDLGGGAGVPVVSGRQRGRMSIIASSGKQVRVDATSLRLLG